MKEKTFIMDEIAINRAISRLSFEIIENNKGIDDIIIFGIITRGNYIAQRIAKKISEHEKKPIAYAELDITPYRDDERRRTHEKSYSKLLDKVNGKKVVLVDDVIYTGRTARAAIEAVLRHGRPKTIQLAVLIDRGHRELPIRPDYIGKNVPTSKNEQIKVNLTECDEINSVEIIK